MSAPAAREVELKLQVSPSDLGRIESLPALRSIADGPPVRHQLRTVYYDTPDLRLAAASVALRLRGDGGRFVQTIKTLSDDGPGDSAGVSVRREWDWPLAGDRPDLSLLETSGAGGLVPRDLRDRLVPIFETRFTRTVLIVRPGPRTTVEVAIDDGEIIAGERRERISELELELVEGRMGRLFALALAILHFIPLRISTENKAEIGYRLVSGRRPSAHAVEPVALAPPATVAEAFRHVVRHGIRQILANQACAIDGADAEGLHRIRVALRQLRVGLRLFRPVIASGEVGDIRNELRWAIGVLRLARDWDVLASGVLAPLAGDDPPVGLDALRSVVDVARRSPARSATEALKGMRFSRLVLGLGMWLEEGRWCDGASPAMRAAIDQPMVTFAGPWLFEQYTRVRKTGKAIETGGTLNREKLRTRLRRLSYAVAFFRGLYPSSAVRPFLAALEPLQTELDRAHDSDSACEILAGLTEIAGSAEMVMARIAEDDRETSRRIQELWRGFQSVAPFW